MNDNLNSQCLGQNYYSKLSRFLAAGNWKAADQETFRVMCEVVGHGRGDILSAEDIRTFPKLDLFTIDQLWTKYSDGKFGFSVQRKLWQHFHRPRNHNRDWERLITTVGWRNAQGKQLRYQELAFDRTAPKGHLPCSVYGLKPFVDLEQFEVGNCEWFMFRAFSDRLKSLKMPTQPITIPKTPKKETKKVTRTPSLEQDRESHHSTSKNVSVLNQPLEVFISYAREDESLKRELESHLSAMVRLGKIKPWHAQMIEAGIEWDSEKQAQIAAAKLILLLITPSFIASDYIYDHELKQAMERHRSGTARVVPIILRPVDFEGTTFSKLQALPQDKIAVTLWSNKDSAFENIAKGIRRVVESLTDEV